MILAVCGKGGVGKTTISAVAAATLYDAGSDRALVVDGDPSGGLSMALGLKAKKSLNDVRKEIIDEVKAGQRNLRDLVLSMDYLLTEALTEKGNLAFLEIGRPEDVGCYCRVNTLLRETLESVAENFDSTVIDAEAGIEQINRQVMNVVDYLLLVSDTSAKGIKVAEEIDQVADEMVGEFGSGLVLNRVRNESDVERVREKTSLEVIGWVPEDETMRGFDEEERPFFDLPECPGREAVRSALRKTGLVT